MELEPQRIKLLLIQENPAYETLLRKRLKDDPLISAEIVCARTLSQAQVFLEKGDIELVLMETSLPDASGLDAFLSLDRQYPFVPVILLTSMDEEKEALEAIQRGAQDYMLKGEIFTQSFSRKVRYALERHRMRVQLMNLSLRDELTSLYNRRGFYLLAEQQIKLASRSQKESLFLLIDVDGLKSINDVHGHLQGDAALVHTGEVLTRSLRKSDIIARLGGDEFAAVAIEAAEHGAAVIRSRIQVNLNKVNAAGELPFTLSLSVGIACYTPNSDTSLEMLLSQADSALYESKRLRPAV